MAGTFNTSFVTEIILKLPELNHSAEIYTKRHLTDKSLNYDLTLGRDILHKLGIIFNFENKTIIWQEVSIAMKLPNCTAKQFQITQKTNIKILYWNYFRNTKKCLMEPKENIQVLIIL